MPSKTGILYPIFLKCCDYIQTDFWKSIFEDLAYGKAPYGIQIDSKGVLSCMKKDKIFSYSIKKDADAKKIVRDLIDMFQQIKTISEIDKLQERINNIIETNKKHFSECDWNSIRKKSDKDMLLEQYVIDMKHEYNLTYEQARMLLSIINIAITFKVITNGDVNYSNMKIHSIDGITFSPGNYTFERCIYGRNKNE